MSQQNEQENKSQKVVAPVIAIKKYFFPTTPLGECKAELNALTAEDRAELGPLCAAELGLELK